MAEEKKATHGVFTVEGNLHSPHANEEIAQATCNRVNKQAENMGLKTRYEVKTL